MKYLNHEMIEGGKQEKKKPRYSKTLLYCPSIHCQTRVSPRISAVPFSVCSNNPVKMPNSHTAIRHSN